MASRYVVMMEMHIRANPFFFPYFARLLSLKGAVNEIEGASRLPKQSASLLALQVRLLQKIQLSWGILVDIEYEPDLQEPDGIGFIRGPIYVYEMLLT
jgi:hypothetical protein